MSAEDINLTKLKQSKVPIIWVLGGPGSGKGTQCDRLVKRYGFVHISSGDLLRAEVAAKTPKGKQIDEMMKKGQLVSDDIVLDLLKQAMLKQVASAKGYLIDGYPRKIEQGKSFDSKIKPCSLIIYFDCSDDTMTKRLLERGKTSGRTDDNAESIKKRLVTFHKESEPVMGQYKSKVAKIDANGPADGIFDKAHAEVDKVLTAAGLPVPK